MGLLKIDGIEIKIGFAEVCWLNLPKIFWLSS